MDPLPRSYFSRSIRGLSSACSLSCEKGCKGYAQTARDSCRDTSLFTQRTCADKTCEREKSLESQNAIQGQACGRTTQSCASSRRPLRLVQIAPDLPFPTKREQILACLRNCQLIPGWPLGTR